MANVKARFWVQSCERQANGVDSFFRKVTLKPVVRPTNDNIEWSKYTPTGEITLSVTADQAGEWFENMLGKDVSITFDVPEEFPDGMGK